MPASIPFRGGDYASPVAADGCLFFLAVSAAVIPPSARPSTALRLPPCLSPVSNSHAPPRNLWLPSFSGEGFPPSDPSPSLSLSLSSSGSWAIQRTGKQERRDKCERQQARS
ncbi:hypothetical protein LY76DRAFT_342129 [Colletotrichum caudatum]|nr:hypothetical protein LY76DRAFT_342129 [Colletotrichum caudatum]